MSPDTTYEQLLERPADALTMIALADALDLDHKEQLSHAYRWAAWRGKWPCLRWERVKKSYRQVWDWDAVGRNNEMSEMSRLSSALYRAICKLEDKTHGTIHDAFVLLGRGLAVLQEKGVAP